MDKIFYVHICKHDLQYLVSRVGVLISHLGLGCFRYAYGVSSQTKEPNPIGCLFEQWKLSGETHTVDLILR